MPIIYDCIDSIVYTHICARLKVPEGRACHLFITHSTHDQEWARSMVMSLSSRWKVKACYQFMPDPSCYNNSDIRDTMMRSCVILVGISHPYLRSSRLDIHGD